MGFLSSTDLFPKASLPYQNLQLDLKFVRDVSLSKANLSQGCPVTFWMRTHFLFFHTNGDVLCLAYFYSWYLFLLSLQFSEVLYWSLYNSSNRSVFGIESVFLSSLILSLHQVIQREFLVYHLIQNFRCQYFSLPQVIL